ncbi:MAG TPA: site-2 protease family protein [Pyrinomonadaceae bacterium]|jgi:membrane-associated protease RseP (regulator of RpoE activity)|nr:site-2 protease family protein [Pyrinomonadaceae bacterium]
MSESVRDIPAFASRDALAARGASRPGARAWARHAFLFTATALTVAWAGMSLAIPADKVEPLLASPSAPLEYLLFIPKYYVLMLAGVASYALAHPHYILEGFKFAAALLSILLAHESGHYVACRLYGVEATLPFFIPVPPPFIVGTLGAFIKIKSPIPSRRALFDIGVAGPLAGFAVILPVAVVGLLTAVPDTTAAAAAAQGGSVIVFNDPALLRMLAAPLGVRDLGVIAPNPFYFAAWFGLLVTSLNLMPVGQLDGGHAVYALLGRRAHRHIGRVAFLAMLALAPLGWLWHGAPTSVLYVALLFVMLRLPHPAPLDDRDTLGLARTLLGLLTLIVFALSFLPFPLTIT